jgi:hypothetical protein
MGEDVSHENHSLDPVLEGPFEEVFKVVEEFP